ncbi:MAG: IPT/TIG domain-containing protein [Theionarchaea archaeon]|nr:IPT/TIG domain-containing protein [Theionarchaea archaeon]
MKGVPLLLLCLCLIGIVPYIASEGDNPTLLAARSGPEGAIFLKWNGAGEIFVVYRGAENLFESAHEIARVNGTAFTDYPGMNGETYYYWVTKISEDVESLPSPPATAVCDAGSPTVSLTSPSDGTLITGALTIRGTAADAETGVSQVEVSVNGTWHLADSTSSWQFSLASPPEGEISIEARAQDLAGNMGNSELITVFSESVPPEIQSIEPVTIESETQTILYIYGKNFFHAPQILVGTHPCDVTFISEQRLTASVPPLAAGSYDVTVINPDGQSDTLSAAITVIEPNSPPVILSVAVQPQFIPNNGMTTAVMTARVTDEDDNLKSVVIDLSSLGGSSTPMKDDGVFPDRTAGDSFFSASAVATKEIEEGTYSLKITATDEKNATDEDQILLTIVEDPPDNPPELINYTVTPSSGTTTTSFTYSVTYKDKDNNVPTYVTITITGVGTFAMIESNPSDYNYMDGKNYYYQHSGLGTGTHSYTISASDGTNPISVGATGPTVSGTNTPPDLLSQQVTPSSGTQSSNFRYKVTYKDADNDDPASIDITITGIGTFGMSELDPSDQYFKDGKVYYVCGWYGTDGYSRRKYAFCTVLPLCITFFWHSNHQFQV